MAQLNELFQIRWEEGRCNFPQAVMHCQLGCSVLNQPGTLQVGHQLFHKPFSHVSLNVHIPLLELSKADPVGQESRQIDEQTDGFAAISLSALYQML